MYTESMPDTLEIDQKLSNIEEILWKTDYGSPGLTNAYDRPSSVDH